MKTLIVSAFVVGTVLCMFYFDNCDGATVVSTNPAVVANKIAAATKSANGTVLMDIKIMRLKRQANCDYRESPGHRCRFDCHCSRQRYCSSHGFCHNRSRERRQDDDNSSGQDDDVSSQEDETSGEGYNNK